jgi:dTDP-4-dehydrorhamnose reductase
MLNRARRGDRATVVADQLGRPTFADDIAAAIMHLLKSAAPFGPYHVTGTGPPVSWADLVRATFQLAGRDPALITDTTTTRYRQQYPHTAIRPPSSLLNTAKVERAGVPLADWRERLTDYVRAANDRHHRRKDTMISRRRIQPP